MAEPGTEAPRWRWLVGTAGGVVLGGVLLVAAVAKALDPTAFAAEIAAQGLTIGLSAGALAVVAVALEALLGAALLLGLRRTPVLVSSAALVAFFLFLTGRAYWRWAQGETLPEAGCGCFGNLVQRTPAEAFWQDLALLVPPLLLAFVGRPRRLRALPWRVGLVTATTAAAALLAWKAPELPLDDLATRLRPGVQVGELCVEGAEGEECLDSPRVLPEAASGVAVVVIAALDAETGGAVDALNEYHWQAEGPPLYVLAAASEEELFQFHFGYGPAFDVRSAPPAMLRPLYRDLPRSFLVRDGEVVATWPGLPPLDELAAGDGPS